MPKSFIKRWIIPGLVLQLIVNPAMKDVSALVAKFGYFLVETDPARFLRWNITLFTPLWNLLCHYFYQSIFNAMKLLLDISFL